jgi:hypothetical protein
VSKQQIYAKNTVFISALDSDKTFAARVLAALAGDDSPSLLDHTVQHGSRRMPIPKAASGAPMKRTLYVSIRLAFANTDEAARAALFLKGRFGRSTATIGVCKNVKVPDCRIENIGALHFMDFVITCISFRNRIQIMIFFSFV